MGFPRERWGPPTAAGRTFPVSGGACPLSGSATEAALVFGLQCGAGWLGRSAATLRKWLKALIASHVFVLVQLTIDSQKQQLRADEISRRLFTMFTSEV